MKTPRELILERRQNAVPALDTIRQQALRDLGERPTEAPPRRGVAAWFGMFSLPRWQVAGLGAAWTAVALFHVAAQPELPTQSERAVAPSGDMTLAVREHQRRVREYLETPQAGEVQRKPGRQSRVELEIVNT